MMGTPGIFLIRLFKSLSHVATINTRWAATRFTKQSSAYVPLCVQASLLKRLSLATRKATVYFLGNFCNSAMTQSVTQTVVGAARQWSMEREISSLFATEKLTKLVSMRTRKGGPKEGLYWKNIEEGFGFRSSLALSVSFWMTGAAEALDRALVWRRSSFGEIRRLTSANFRVRFALPILDENTFRVVDKMVRRGRVCVGADAY